MIRRILVTGASGFIGKHLCSYLNDKYTVISMVTNKNKAEGVDVVEADITKPINKLPDVDAIIHLAALIKAQNPYFTDDYLKVNAYGTFNLLNAANNSNIKNFILASTMNVYKSNSLNVKENEEENPKTPYGLSKLMSELCAKFYSRNFDFKVVVLRCSGVYGQGRPEGIVYKALTNAMENKLLEVDTDQDTSWDPVYIKDIVDVYTRALDFSTGMKTNFEIFNVGYGNQIKIQELIDTIIKITGSKSQVIYKNEKSGLNFFMNIDKAKKLLKFYPRNLKDSLKDYFEVLKNE